MFRFNSKLLFLIVHFHFEYSRNIHFIKYTQSYSSKFIKGDISNKKNTYNLGDTSKLLFHVSSVVKS